jgi:tetratricopeptide (TPR) repeat protein
MKRMMDRVLITALAVLGAFVAPRAAEATSRAGEIFAEGLAYHREAEAATSSTVALDFLKKAISRYRLAVEADPQHYPAQSMWGIGLTQLAELETNRAARSALIAEARERVRIAAACPDADARAEQHWGSFLLLREFPVTQLPAERWTLLQEARGAFEAALRRSAPGTPTAVVHGLLGQCLALMSAQTTDPSEEMTLLRASRQHYESMAQADPQYRDTGTQRGWGYVLIQLYRQDSDPALLTEAIARLEAARTSAPKDLVVFYNLACALALQGRPAEAFENLKVALDQDPQLVFFNNAEQDPDLAPVRALPQYQQRVAAAKTRLAVAQATELTNAGAALQREAESLTNDLARAVSLWHEAIAHYRSAVEKQPDNTRAQFLWAISLAQLSRAAARPAESRRLAELARERFAIAARLPGADVTVHEQRGLFLQTLALTQATNPVHRTALLGETREALTTALREAKFTGHRARLAAQLGSVLVQLAQDSPPAVVRPLLREALTHFETTRKVEKLENPAELYDHWGVALLRLGQLDRNSMQLRQAIERFQTALEHNPDRLESRYNLACAYALLNQPTSALRHLRQCLDHDTNGVFRTGIQTDPDLAAVRDTAEYRELFGPPSIETLVDPKLPRR